MPDGIEAQESEETEQHQPGIADPFSCAHNGLASIYTSHHRHTQDHTVYLYLMSTSTKISIQLRKGIH